MCLNSLFQYNKLNQKVSSLFMNVIGFLLFNITIPSVSCLILHIDVVFSITCIHIFMSVQNEWDCCWTVSGMCFIFLQSLRSVKNVCLLNTKDKLKSCIYMCVFLVLHRLLLTLTMSHCEDFSRVFYLITHYITSLSLSLPHIHTSSLTLQVLFKLHLLAHLHHL